MKLIVGNQKTYLDRDKVLNFIEKTGKVDCSNVVICPSYPYFELFNNKSNFILGSQDVSETGLGASTGEVSAEQLKSFHVQYAIVGHSERRSYQHEDSNVLYHKIKCLLESDIRPIFCIGECLEERESDSTKDVIGKQILEVFDRLEKSEIEKIIIAYEPIWAIGTGITPVNDEIMDTTNYIKDLVNDKFDVSILVLYGGSVNKENISQLGEISAIDGYLIGGASTKADEFLEIMRENSK